MKKRGFEVPVFCFVWLLAVCVSTTSAASAEQKYQENKCANVNAAIHSAAAVSAKKQQDENPATVIPAKCAATTAISEKVHVYLLYFFIL